MPLVPRALALIIPLLASPALAQVSPPADLLGPSVSEGAGPVQPSELPWQNAPSTRASIQVPVAQNRDLTGLQVSFSLSRRAIPTSGGSLGVGQKLASFDEVDAFLIDPLGGRHRLSHAVQQLRADGSRLSPTALSSIDEQALRTPARSERLRLVAPRFDANGLPELDGDGNLAWNQVRCSRPSWRHDPVNPDVAHERCSDGDRQTFKDTLGAGLTFTAATNTLMVPQVAGLPSAGSWSLEVVDSRPMLHDLMDAAAIPGWDVLNPPADPLVTRFAVESFDLTFYGEPEDLLAAATVDRIFHNELTDAADPYRGANELFAAGVRPDWIEVSWNAGWAGEGDAPDAQLLLIAPDGSLAAILADSFTTGRQQVLVPASSLPSQWQDVAIDGTWRLEAFASWGEVPTADYRLDWRMTAHGPSTLHHDLHQFTDEVVLDGSNIETAFFQFDAPGREAREVRIDLSTDNLLGFSHEIELLHLDAGTSYLPCVADENPRVDGCLSLRLDGATVYARLPAGETVHGTWALLWTGGAGDGFAELSGGEGESKSCDDVDAESQASAPRSEAGRQVGASSAALYGAALTVSESNLSSEVFVHAVQDDLDLLLGRGWRAEGTAELRAALPRARRLLANGQRLNWIVNRFGGILDSGGVGAYAGFLSAMDAAAVEAGMLGRNPFGRMNSGHLMGAMAMLDAGMGGYGAGLGPVARSRLLGNGMAFGAMLDLRAAERAELRGVQGSLVADSANITAPFATAYVDTMMNGYDGEPNHPVVQAGAIILGAPGLALGTYAASQVETLDLLLMNPARHGVYAIQDAADDVADDLIDYVFDNAPRTGTRSGSPPFKTETGGWEDDVEDPVVTTDPDSGEVCKTFQGETSCTQTTCSEDDTGPTCTDKTEPVEPDPQAGGQGTVPANNCDPDATPNCGPDAGVAEAALAMLGWLNGRAIDGHRDVVGGWDILDPMVYCDSDAQTCNSFQQGRVRETDVGALTPYVACDEAGLTCDDASFAVCSDWHDPAVGWTDPAPEGGPFGPPRIEGPTCAWGCPE